MTDGANAWTEAWVRGQQELLRSWLASAAPASGPAPMPLLEMPALGATREQQEAWQRLGALSARVAEAQAKLSVKWGEVLQRALAAVADRVRAAAEAGAPVQSLKALYDLWIECAEGAYSDTANGSEYIALQAELANATSALRIEQRGLIERWAREYDLPTRAELDSVHLRLKELGAQLRALEAGAVGPRKVRGRR